MGCIISSAACCFASSAASLCCSCLPSCKGSTSTRLMYTFILILTAVISIIMLIPDLEKHLTKIPYLCPGGDCSSFVGFAAVYRVNFASVMFYLLFCLLTCGVKSSSDIRGKINNGFWFFKFLIWIALIVASFFMPSGFNYPWMIIGIIGGVLYLLIQLILLIDFAYTWSENWVERYEEGSKAHLIGMVFFTILLYAASIIAVALFYVYYASDVACTLHKAFISVNLILCVIISVVSILPAIHEHLPNSGLLQSAVISMYIIYQTWSAMTNSPLKMCNPTLQQFNTTTDEVQSIHLAFQWQTAVGLIILLISVAYAAFKSSSSTSAGKLALSGVEETNLGSGPGILDKEGGALQGQQVWDNETDGTTYNYSLFHFIQLLACLYLMMTLTNWYSPKGVQIGTLSPSPASEWIKIATSWVCSALYLWTLMAPCIFPDRDFS